MRTTLLLTALLCGSAQASDITIDIWRPPDLNEYGNPDPGGIPTVFVGSYTMPGSPFSPELNFHADTLDWRPFGLSYFKADIHGTFCVATPGTGRLMMQGGLGGIASWGAFSIDNNPASFLQVGSIDGRYQDTFTLAQGVHSFDLIYIPGQKETDVPNNEVQILPDGKDGIAIIDEDHAWFPDKLGVPESDGWLLWLVPAGILLLVPANFGKTKRRVMKTTLLFTALFCGSAQANLITVDIEGNTTPIGRYTDPNANVTGSYTVPGSQYSPELNFHADTLDWRPFGATYFTAHIHGTFTVATPGTDRLMMTGGIGGRNSLGAFTIDNNPYPSLWVSFMDERYENTVTLAQGVHSFDLIYQPGIVQTLVGPGDVASLPDGKNGIAIVDVDHTWGPTSSVPESTWLVWLFPLGLLLWRRK